MTKSSLCMSVSGIELLKLSERELEHVLRLDEGHFMDLKSKDITPSKLSKTIAAFANAEGGELYIGVEDSPRIWNGFLNQEEANAHLQVFETLFPLGEYYSYDFLDCSLADGLVLRVSVKRSRAVVRASNEKVYLRRGAQSLSRNDEQIEILKRNKGITSFEVEPVNCPVEFVTNSEAIINFVLDVVPQAEPESWLKKQLLINEAKPTVAGLVLFSDEPQIALPKRCGIKIYRYKTTGKEGVREVLEFTPLSIEGCAVSQIAEAVRKTVEIVQSVKVISPAGMIAVEYPREALHEVITNAVIHRDYYITDDVHIKIFDNRIEILSPGCLAGHVTVKNILRERCARNPTIVRLINKFPDAPNKDIGEGLNTTFDAMRKMKLKAPIIELDGGYVKVVLSHERLATPEEAILAYLETNDSIANRDARTITFIESENQMKRILQAMVASDMLEAVPGRSRYNAAYQLRCGGALGEEDQKKSEDSQMSLEL